MKHNYRYQILDSMECVVAEADSAADALFAYHKHNGALLFDTRYQRCIEVLKTVESDAKRHGLTFQA